MLIAQVGGGAATTGGGGGAAAGAGAAATGGAATGVGAGAAATGGATTGAGAAGGGAATGAAATGGAATGCAAAAGGGTGGTAGASAGWAVASVRLAARTANTIEARDGCIMGSARSGRGADFHPRNRRAEDGRSIRDPRAGPQHCQSSRVTRAYEISFANRMRERRRRTARPAPFVHTIPRGANHPAQLRRFDAWHRRCILRHRCYRRGRWVSSTAT